MPSSPPSPSNCCCVCPPSTLSSTSSAPSAWSSTRVSTRSIHESRVRHMACHQTKCVLPITPGQVLSYPEQQLTCDLGLLLLMAALEALRLFLGEWTPPPCVCSTGRWVPPACFCCSSHFNRKLDPCWFRFSRFRCGGKEMLSTELHTHIYSIYVMYIFWYIYIYIYFIIIV